MAAGPALAVHIPDPVWWLMHFKVNRLLGHSDPVSWLTSFGVTAENHPVRGSSRPARNGLMKSKVKITLVDMVQSETFGNTEGGIPK